MTAQSRNWPELLLGLGIVLAGAIIGWQATGVKVAPIYAKVGPAAFLWFAAALLIVCGLIVAWRAAARPVDEGFELRGPMEILLALGVAAGLINLIGFIPVAILVFVLTSHALGSTRLVRDIIVGVILSIVAYLVFAMGLGLRLPLGEVFA
ncbi:MAG: tripartite tricarboxylate transporter TctB family protein [Aestuariivirga sp.]